MENKVNGYDTIIRDLKVAGFRYILKFEYTGDECILKNSVIDALRKKKVDTSALGLKKIPIKQMNNERNLDSHKILFNVADKIAVNIDSNESFIRGNYDFLTAGVYGKIDEILSDLYDAVKYLIDGNKYERNERQKQYNFTKVDEYVDFYNAVVDKNIYDTKEVYCTPYKIFRILGMKNEALKVDEERLQLFFENRPYKEVFRALSYLLDPFSIKNGCIFAIEKENRCEFIDSYGIQNYFDMTRFSIPYIVENNDDLGNKKIRDILDKYLPFI